VLWEVLLDPASVSYLQVDDVRCQPMILLQAAA
jgi:hypothetical protein